MVLFTSKFNVMTFQEFTFIEPSTQCEIMVDITMKGNISDAYTYVSDIDALNEYLDEDDKKPILWKVGRNPLFAHNKNALRRLSYCLVVSPHTLEGWELLHLCKDKHKFTFEILDPLEGE